MDNINTSLTEAATDKVVPPSRNFGYGNWLQPIINANDRSESAVSNAGGASSSTPPAAQRRGRGRPSVAKPRNESAIEKRRAQVREAQRSYQKRKDTATATEKKRADELLTLLSDLSTDVENLLQAASAAGSMHRHDHVSKSIQRLWSTYDTVINNECVKPEMRLLQIKNSQRLASQEANADPPASSIPHAVTNVDAITNAGAVEDLETAELSEDTFVPFNPSAMRFDLVRFEGTTVMSSFQRTAATDSYMAGRNIFDIVKERQAAMKAADRQQNEQNSQGDQ